MVRSPFALRAATSREAFSPPFGTIKRVEAGQAGTFYPGWRFAYPGLLHVTLSGLMEFYFLNNRIFRMGKRVAHPTD